MYVYCWGHGPCNTAAARCPSMLRHELLFYLKVFMSYKINTCF